jgi:hypothetical protein
MTTRKHLFRLRRQLKDKLKAEVQIASKKALANDGTDISDHVKRIETYNKLIASLPRRRTEFQIAILFAVIAFTVVAYVSVHRIPQTKILLTIQGNGLEVDLDQSLLWANGLQIEANPLRLEWLTHLQLPPLNAPVPNDSRGSLEGNPWVQIDGGQVTLAKIAVAKGGRLTIESDPEGFIDIFTGTAELKGELLLSGLSHVAAGVRSAYAEPDLTGLLDQPIPESLTFRAARSPTAAIRAHLRFRPYDELVVNDLIVRYLSFSREIPGTPGERVFVSSITGGTLELTDVSRSLELRKGERLSLQGVSGRIVELRAAEQIYVEFEGTVEMITLGPKGFAQDVTPTLLEHLYHNQRLLLFWSALVFLWGILWNVRVFLVR